MTAVTSEQARTALLTLAAILPPVLPVNYYETRVRAELLRMRVAGTAIVMDHADDAIAQARAMDTIMVDPTLSVAERAAALDKLLPEPHPEPHPGPLMKWLLIHALARLLQTELARCAT